MKKIFIIFWVCLLLFTMLTLFLSCKSSDKDVRITPVGDEKVVEIHYNDTVIQDTAFIVPAEISDTLIIGEAQLIEDYAEYEQFRTDSLYKVFQQDSINFRKITKIINGGYNGWDNRYKLWINAIEVINQHNNKENQ